MKGGLRPVGYIAWAHSVPSGARFDLTASGVRDAAMDPDSPPLPATLDVAGVVRRDRRETIMGDLATAIGERYGVEPALVTPTLGASQAITQTLLALVRPGEHVIVERPTYEPLHRIPDTLGFHVSRLERKYDEGWRLVADRLAQLLTPRTRAVILTNLHNPSGVAIDPAELIAIGEMAARVGAIVLVDEVYLDFCFDPADPGGDHRPACLTVPNAVSWSSTTKCFGYSALRVGWMVTRDEEIAGAIRAASHFLHVDYPLATAALATHVLGNAAELRQRALAQTRSARRIIDRWIEAEDRVDWIAPPAGLSGLLRLPNLMQDLRFAQHLRDRYDTQVVPGTLFEAPGMVRVSFGLPERELEQALANFSATLDELG